MEKLDLTQKFRSYYSAQTQPEFQQFGTVEYLSILGSGDPSSDEFSQKVEALYTVAYTLKFLSKAQNQDFSVAKLEGLWWFDESKYRDITIDDAPVMIPRSEWSWRLLVRIPSFITPILLETAKKNAFKKKKIELIEQVDFFSYDEGEVVQMLHVGAFSEEPLSLKVLGDFMSHHQLSKGGFHHEIYLSDFRKTPPEKLKTILREPIKRNN
ncbi:MAG: GyrI-like domain-containing protein [Spirosomataceae bacterium]